MPSAQQIKIILRNAKSQNLHVWNNYRQHTAWKLKEDNDRPWALSQQQLGFSFFIQSTQHFTDRPSSTQPQATRPVTGGTMTHHSQST